MTNRLNDPLPGRDRDGGFGRRVSPQVRAEIFALGARHRGDPLAGARHELKATGLTWERRALLHDIVRRLTPDGAQRWRRESTGEPSRPANLKGRQLLYVVAIIGSLAWIGAIVGGHFG